MPSKWTRLIELRKAAGLSQYELARRLKLSRSALGNYEQGEREPDFETTARLADFFGVSVDHLLGREMGKPQGQAGELPREWRRMLGMAQAEGYSPDQVLTALRLLDTVRKQTEAERKTKREG